MLDCDSYLENIIDNKKTCCINNTRYDLPRYILNLCDVEMHANFSAANMSSVIIALFMYIKCTKITEVNLSGFCTNCFMTISLQSLECIDWREIFMK